MADLNRKGDLDVKIVDGSDTSTVKATIETDPDTSETELITRSHLRGYSETSSSWKRLQVDDDDQLKISGISRPSGAASANFNHLDTNVTKNGGSSTSDYTITSGKTYTLTNFSAGGYTLTSKVELYFGVPAANEVGMTLVTVLYIDGATVQLPILQEFTGDGTNVLRIKLVNNTSNNDEMFGEIVGYEL